MGSCPTHLIKREVGAYLGVAFSLATAVAATLPNAGIDLLLSVMVPTVSVVIVTFTVTPLGRLRDTTDRAMRR